MSDHRPMTDDEKAMALAIEPPKVSYVPGIPTKRFARDIAAEARSENPHITTGQASYLRAVVVRFRRQIPASVVELARKPMVPS